MAGEGREPLIEPARQRSARRPRPRDRRRDRASARSRSPCAIAAGASRTIIAPGPKPSTTRPSAASSSACASISAAASGSRSTISGRQQHLPLDPALLALKLQPLIDDALVRGVLVDDDDAVARLRDDVILVQLRPRRAKRSREVALVGRAAGARARTARTSAKLRLRGLGEACGRGGRGAPVPAGRIGRRRGMLRAGAWRGSSPSRRSSRRDAAPRSSAA